ncbi:hypothetical protein M0208_11430 [Sphingomonas sp. SUN019]|uniref:hypothetical protein n=1 Tax=Sphingomonas sp. SUN019 TaxID=2937788 RepID=UPI002164661A|nr:hypothetical protein [Sphingomonas sp. SUN019]UVO51100.1 hypothetical protein M0208_11430 [Sphingomonas sp. SUN019]
MQSGADCLDRIDVAHGKSIVPIQEIIPQSFITSRRVIPYPESKTNLAIVDLLWEYPVSDINITGLPENVKVDCAVSCNLTEWHDADRSFDNSQVARSYQFSGKLGIRYIRVSVSITLEWSKAKVEVPILSSDVIENESNRYKIGSDKPVSVAIIGTSNSVMHYGYVSTLGNSRINITINASLGSSHPVVLPFRRTKISNENIDLFIIDLNVNEQNALNSGHYDIETTEMVLRDHARWCFERKAIPVVLLMPERSGLLGQIRPSVPSARDNYINICNKMRLPYFDGYEFTWALAEELDRSPDSLIKGVNHLTHFSSQILGKVLSRALATLFETVSLSRNLDDVAPFDYAPVAYRRNMQELIVRKTALGEESFIRLSEGDSFYVRNVRNCEVVGVVLNMSQSRGALRLYGENQLIKQLSTPFGDGKKPMILVCWSLTTPVRVGDRALKIACMSDEGLDGRMEATDLAYRSTPEEEKIDVGIEICGFITRGQPERVSMASTTGAELKLFRRSDLRSVLA